MSEIEKMYSETVIKRNSGVIRLQTEEVDTYIRFQVCDKDPQRQIIVFWQCGSDQMYYLGTVRLNDKDKQWYVILDDLSTEFTMEEVMSEFNKQFEEKQQVREILE